MGRDGKPTKDKILTESKALVLENGFAGTSIDQILEKTSITKGAFFYHFKSKNELAKALIEEHAREDKAEMDKVLERTEHLESDPLNRLLQFVQEFIDMMSSLPTPYPGCLYASYIYETQSFGQEINNFICDSISLWRATFESLLNSVLEEYDTKLEVDMKSLADMFKVIFEGAFIVSKALDEPDVMAKQLRHLKNYFELIFEPIE